MSSLRPTAGEFHGLVVAHAAVHGGMIVTFGHHFAEGLVKEGAELHFFVSQEKVFGQRPPTKDLGALGGQSHGLPITERFAPCRMIWTLALMALGLRRFGVQVLHTRGSIMGGIGRVAAKIARVPVVIHHQDDLHSREARLSPLTRRFVAFVESRLSRLADRSLFVSDVVLKDAVAVGFPEERCVLVGNDLNDVFENAMKEPRGTKEPVLSQIRGLGVPEGAQVVGCLGRLVHHKGIDLFVDAAALLAPAFPQWVFLIKGDGPMREHLLSSVIDKQLSNRVFFLSDELPRLDLPALYRCFDVFTLPSRREGFGLAFAEAMAMGVPVVGPRMAPVTEVVPEDCGLLVDPENVEALVQALGALMTSGDLRSRVADRARKHASATWCSRKAADRVIDVYRGLLKEKNLMPPRNEPGS